MWYHIGTVFQNVDQWAAREKVSWGRFRVQNDPDPSEGLPGLLATEEAATQWNALTLAERYMVSAQ